MKTTFVECPACAGVGAWMRFEVNALANFWSDWILFDKEVFNKCSRKRLKEKRYCSVCAGKGECTNVKSDAYYANGLKYGKSNPDILSSV
jgi:MoaA/NifB/PqqE/SkfB family radical SAM enzyme